VRSPRETAPHRTLLVVDGTRPADRLVDQIRGYVAAE
jgi:hypothetical protein